MGRVIFTGNVALALALRVSPSLWMEIFVCVVEASWVKKAASMVCLVEWMDLYLCVCVCLYVSDSEIKF